MEEMEVIRTEMWTGGRAKYPKWKCVDLKSGSKIGFRGSRVPFKCDIVFVKQMDGLHTSFTYTATSRRLQI